MVTITRKEPEPSPDKVVIEVDELTAKAVKLALHMATKVKSNPGEINYVPTTAALEKMTEVRNALSTARVYYDDQRIASF